MSERILTRGDDYPSTKRPVYRYVFVTDALDPSTQEPLPHNLAGCTIRATFRAAPVDPTTDPDDAGAAIAAVITFDGSGAVTGTSSGWALPVGHTAAMGVLDLVLDRVATAALPLAPQLKSDVQVTDSDGDVTTILMLGTLTTQDGYTSTAP